MLSTSLSTQGATPRRNWLDTLHDKIAPKSSSSPLSTNRSTASTALTPGQFGGATQPGMISQPKPQPTAPIAKTVDASGTTTHYATKANPSVLAQQQALNKMGAGLVEDGIVGPRTREAIAKYGASGASASASKPVASTTSSTTSSKPKTDAVTAPTSTSTPPPTPTYPGLITSLANQQNSPYNQATQQSIQNLNNSGNSQYNDTARTAIKGLLGSAEGNQVYADRAENISKAAGQKISDIGRAGVRGQAGYLTTGTSPVGEGNAAVLAQTTAAQQQAVEQGANMQLAGNSQGLAAQGQKQAGFGAAAGQALSGQGTQQSAFSSAGGLAQTGQGNTQGALSSATGFAQPQYPSYGNAQYDPLTGTYKTVGGGQYGSGPTAATNVQSIQDAQGKINTIDQSSQSIGNNFSRAINYATTAGLTGSSPILEGFKNRFGTGFLTNPSVVGFNQAISALNTQLQAFGEQPIDINTATAQTLQQAQETVKKDLLTQKTNYQDFISQFNSGGGSSGPASKGGNLFGSFF